MARSFRPVAVVLLAVAAAACPPPAKPKPIGDTTVTVDGDPPDFPGDFDPAEPLPDPLPPEPSKFGLVWLEKVHASLREGWAGFLEDCRLRLPPDHPLNSPALETRIEIQVRASGEVARVTTVASSGNADFDAVAEEVVREAGTLPAPPREVLSDDDLAYVTWQFARDRRQAGVATAELERTEWPLEQAVPKFIEDGNLAEAARRLDKAAAGGDGARLDALAGRLMVAVLREGLRSADPAVQRLAVERIALAAERGDDSLTAAARELRSIADGSLEIDVRAAAIDGLRAIGDRDAAGMLLTILERDQGGNPALSSAAARALVALGAADKAAAVIRGWLTGGDRARIGGGLATLAGAAVPGTVAESARHVTHKDLGVRIAACGALGAAAGGGDAAAWKALRKGLDDRDATVRAACAGGAAAAAAVVKKKPGKAVYWRLVELFKDRDDRTRAAALLAAIRLEPAKVGQELARFGKEKSPDVLAAYAAGLAVVPANSGKPPKKLVELAGHGDAAVRAAAVRALAARSEAVARATAAEMVVDPELEVRLAAVAALDDPAALETLAADPTAEVAAAARARAVVVRGRAASLRDVLAAIAAAPAESEARVQAAGAWLRAR